MQLVQQVQESLLPYLVYKLRRIRIHAHYFAVNTDRSCISEQTLLRGEVEKSKDKYKVLYLLLVSYDVCYLSFIVAC